MYKVKSMKNRGFTLIEVIVTIALLGFVGIIISMNLMKLIDDQKKDKKEEVRMLLEEAVCTYAVLNNDVDIVTGETLVINGYIDEVISGYKIKNYEVEISFDDGERKCELVGEIE